MRQYDLERKNPETALQYAVLRYLYMKGCIAGKTKTMGVKRNNTYCKDRFVFRGFPDITAFVPKENMGYRLIFIEVKSPKGRQTSEQKNFEKHCILAGIPYILARKLEDIEQLFK